MDQLIVNENSSLLSISEEAIKMLNAAPRIFDPRTLLKRMGVYVYYTEHNGVIICEYVGKGDDLNRRNTGPHRHKSVILFGGFMKCIFTNHPLLLEYILIGYLNPRLNKEHKKYFDRYIMNQPWCRSSEKVVRLEGKSTKVMELDVLRGSTFLDELVGSLRGGRRPKSKHRTTTPCP